MLLAYDLYVLRDNMRLQDAVVRRLKNRDQFQGARYELFVAATMIRAGFEIDYEDETDPTSKHPEFVATDKGTGQVVAVEAKSRHRPGVLGRLGESESVAGFRLGIRRLLRDALRKPTEVPYLVFIDANMPPAIASPLSPVNWTDEVMEAVHSTDAGVTKSGLYVGSNFNLLVVTNNPDHYGLEGARILGDVYFTVWPQTAARPLRHPEIRDRIERALRQFGNIAMEFPERLSLDEIQREPGVAGG